ncbi:2-hydroxyacid dehydrogenase [Marinivivus vitaminiproducens]|uniref:2-hydroxyacid dehydrogenase n=1 Tax=Marinivivus vitaminiproducens TaxID=3035935 RepID=UPI0027A4F33F|nr:2-hydroxyacid dehydrogenase [Geminicoccaceae bacterium SCSIO 64248]
MSRTIVFLDPLSPERKARLEALLPTGFVIELAASRAERDQLNAIERADYAVSGDVPITEAMLRHARQLKAVHKWGVGVDNIALATARELGIPVMRTTGSNALPVAESAVASMLALARSVVTGHTALKQEGRWIKGALAAESFTLSAKTVGLVGVGAIGSQVARLLQGFRCRLLYAMPRRLDPALEAELGLTKAGLPELLAESDVVSLHCPLTSETRGLIGKAELAAMKGSAILVNAARGGIVDEAALADALRGGVIRAAAVDVFAVEPVPGDNPLLSLDNVIVTPHCASLSADTFVPTVTRLFANLRRVEHGEPVPEGDRVA